MRSYQVALKGREQVAEGTLQFHLAKPAGFAFMPGQAVDVALAESGHRLFSLVSAPYEDELAVATRMREGSAFKAALKALPIGAEVTLKGPIGMMTLHADRARPALFIAGGIGITPFMSMLRQAAFDRSPQRLHLLYANRRAEDAPFLGELQDLERRNPAFRMHATTSLIDAPLIARCAGGLENPLYYVVGPPGMVEVVQGVLRASEVGEDDIVTEEFFGY
jgi:ferredoxin-NADP reductase